MYEIMKYPATGIKWLFGCNSVTHMFSFCVGLNKGSAKRKNAVRKKVFQIDFDATHEFDKMFSKGKVNVISLIGPFL